jgi:beta-lactamase regulating signal transducer with metallopeptidase domain
MLWSLAQNALVAGLLAGLVALVCRLARFGPAVRHALWLVVLIKLVTPPLIVWPWSLPDMGRVPATAHATAADAANPSEEWLPLVLNLEAILAVDDSLTGEPASCPLGPVASAENESSTTSQAESAAWWQGPWLAPLLFNLWLAGTAVMCLLQILRIARFQRLLARTDPAPRRLEALVAKLAATLRVRRPVTLIVPQIGSPFVWSLGRPKLLWPTSLLERLPHHWQRSIVAHELAHLRRRDHWIGWLQLVAECVWWWNPLFWYVRRQLRLNAELACDAWVVSTLPEDRRAYAEALIEVTELISQTAAPMPALGISSAARQDFERRLTMIMRDRVPCRVPFVGLLAIGVLALVSLPGWSQVQVEVKEVSEVKAATPSEKQVILQVTSDVQYQDVLKVLQEVQKTEGDKVVRFALADPAPAPDHDRRLQKLEAQLQELLKEVQALRGGGSKPQLYLNAVPSTKPGEPSGRPRVQIIERKHTDTKPAPTLVLPEAANPAPKPAVRVFADPNAHVERLKDTVMKLQDGKVVRAIALTRATYKLPHAKALALAEFLEQHGKNEVVETRVEGDSIIVTTTPEAQKAITQFISLLQGATTATTIDGKTGMRLELKPGDADTGKRFFYKIETDASPKKSPSGENKDP